MASSNGHDASEIPYRDLLGRLAEALQRIERLEGNQRAILDLVKEFRDLARVMAARITVQDRRLGALAEQLRFLERHGERIGRHLRN